MTDKQLAVREAAQIVAADEWDAARVDLVARTIAKGATRDELALFVAVCRRTGLDPFLKQIYFVKYGNQVSIQVSIDGYRVQAERSGKYAGQIGPQFCGKDGGWMDAWLSDEPPVAARVGVLRTDFQHPVWATCRFKSYVKQTEFWRTMPDQMLGKCAEALAFRKAFPRELMGLAPRPAEDDEPGFDAPDPGPSPRMAEVRRVLEAIDDDPEPPERGPVMQPEDFFRDDEPTQHEQEQPPADDPLAARRREAAELHAACLASGMRVGPPHPRSTETGLDEAIARYRRMLTARAGRP